VDSRCGVGSTGGRNAEPPLHSSLRAEGSRQDEIEAYSTVVSGWAALENFRSPYFSLGAAVLDSEFRADPESGLRIEQSPAGHIESSGLKISRFQQDFSRIQDLTLRFSATAAVLVHGWPPAGARARACMGRLARACS
jgi:hypothetical protein